MKFLIEIFNFIFFSFLSKEKNPRKRCEQCKTQRHTKDNKTTAVCDLCIAPTCSSHYIRVCEPCYLRKFKDPADLSDAEDSENDENVDGQTSNEPPAKKSRISTINL